MKDIYYHKNENLCSIGRIGDTISGKSIIREVLNVILPKTELVFAKIERPNYESMPSIKSVAEISSEIEELKFPEEGYSMTFKYYPKADNDNFIKTLSRLWLDHEQPTFSFFLPGQEPQFYKDLHVGRQLAWDEVTALAPCYIVYKGIQEDVLWIGWSDNLEFELD